MRPGRAGVEEEQRQASHLSFDRANRSSKAAAMAGLLAARALPADFD